MTYDLTILFQGIYPQETKAYGHTKTNAQRMTTTLLVIAPTISYLIFT